MKVQASIDKVTLIFKPINSRDRSPIDLDTLCERMEKDKWMIKDEWTSHKQGDYKYNFAYQQDGDTESVIYIGCGRNKASADQNPDLVKVEYNPNKTHQVTGLFNALYAWHYQPFEIQSVDYAFDFDIPLNRFRILPKDFRRHIMLYGTVDNLTEYISPKGETERVRIYDKAWERKEVAGKDIAPLTRVEVRIKRHDHRLSVISDILSLLDQVTVGFRQEDADDPITILMSAPETTQLTLSFAFGAMSRNTKKLYKKKMQSLAKTASDCIDQLKLAQFVDRVKRIYSITDCLQSVKGTTDILTKFDPIMEEIAVEEVERWLNQ